MNPTSDLASSSLLSSVSKKTAKMIITRNNITNPKNIHDALLPGSSFKGGFSFKLDNLVANLIISKLDDSKRPPLALKLFGVVIPASMTLNKNGQWIFSFYLADLEIRNRLLSELADETADIALGHIGNNTFEVNIRKPVPERTDITTPIPEEKIKTVSAPWKGARPTAAVAYKPKNHDGSTFSFDRYDG